MSRSRPTKLEKYRARRVQIAHQVLEWARKELQAAESTGKTSDDPDVVLKRHHLAEAQKLWQEAIDAQRGGR